MADILAVMQLAAYGRRFAKVLYQFANDANMGIRELNHFAIQVQSFSDTVGAAQVSLKRHFREYEDSPIKTYVLKNKILETIAVESKFVRRCLKDAKRKVLSINSKYLLWTTIRWSLSKSSILMLQPQMESVKTSLCLLLATAQLEAAHMSMRPTAQISTQHNTDLRQEILFLKKIINGHMRAFELLKTEYQRNSNIQRRNNESSYGTSSQIVDPQAALLELGRTMLESGVVPGAAPSPAEVRLGHSPESSIKEDTTRNAEETPDPVHVPVPPSSQSSSMEIRLKKNIRPIYFTSGHHHDSLYLQITAKSGHKNNITALLDRNMQGNIISGRLAAKLHLGVRPSNPNTGAILKLGNRPSKRSMGIVEMSWVGGIKDGPRGSSLTVECQVCQDNDIGLILGKPFLDKASL